MPLPQTGAGVLQPFAHSAFRVLDDQRDANVMTRKKRLDRFYARIWPKLCSVRVDEYRKIKYNNDGIVFLKTISSKIQMGGFSAMEKMNISFWIWGMFDDGGVYHDLDARMRELRERGFNTIRTESLAGFFAGPDGALRERVHIRRPFGPYGKRVRQMDVLRKDFDLNARESLLRFFRAAQRNGVRVILSSWFFLHTNWLLDDAVNDEIYALSTAEKFRYFTDEYDRILTLLEENDLEDCLAFYEIFNEFTGIYFVQQEERGSIRALHERAIDALHARHPWARAAYDIGATPDELIPRNADVLNYHLYYFWDAYLPFEQGSVVAEAGDPTYGDATRAYTYDQIISVNDIERVRGGRIRSAIDWERRAALYDSIDPAKLTALEKTLEAHLRRMSETWFDAFAEMVRGIVAQRDRVVPDAQLVMGEGVSYCCANDLLFEEHSALYWETVKRQARLLREAGFAGTVVRTTSGPEDPSWSLRRQDYIEANGIFLA